MTPMTSSRWRALWLLLPLLLLALAGLGVLLLAQGGLAPYRLPSATATPVAAATPAQIARGRYLAQIGGCQSCHTRRGGRPFAGGRAFATPYGTLYSSNLGSDPQAGIGGWSRDEFAHALRHGVSRRGPLFPAFPYANYALLDDVDVAALYAYLRTLPAEPESVPEPQLAFPANSRAAVVLWRLRHYRPQRLPPAPERDDRWRRGRYLVEAVGHCSMCHSADGERGSLGRPQHLAGARPSGLGWYAPALDSARLARYRDRELADYLRHGNAPQGAAYGPMAEAVAGGLQALSEDDALAMAQYLLSLPPATPFAPPVAASLATGDPGHALYRRHCADCHGADGEGDGLNYPPLRDAVAVRAPDPTNAVRMLLGGGMPVATAGNPRPFSMPPFAHQVDSSETAQLVGYIRRRWGGHQESLGVADIDRLRGLQGL